MGVGGAWPFQYQRSHYPELAMDWNNELARQQTRRSFLGRSSIGLGAAALSTLLSPDASRATTAVVARKDRAPTDALPGLPHFAPRAKRVIFLCMAGGPSHLETFDYKPMLEKMDGKPMTAAEFHNRARSERQPKLVLECSTRRSEEEVCTYISRSQACDYPLIRGPVLI